MEKIWKKIGNWEIVILFHPDGFGWSATNFKEVIGSGLKRYKTNTKAHGAALEAVNAKIAEEESK